MKKLAFAILFSMLSAGAYAQSAANPAPESDPANQANAAAESASPAAKNIHDRYCLRETGSHIRHRDKNGCVENANGQVYSRRDIDSTGATDVGTALDRLSPSVQVRRH